ncbi:MAG: hypothetical protein H0V68_06285, partial [Actinobacteria bacterium]|nr:hypothetical protein [Actinomycetota bacterium]
MRRSIGAFGGAVAALALAFAFAFAFAGDGEAGSAAKAPRPTTLHVRTDAGFAVAVRRLSRSGGKIVLHPGLYRSLFIPPRSWRPLRIVGTRGARVQRVMFYGTQRVSLGRVRV